MKSAKGMTPAINRAWDALSEILEEPGARDYRKLHRAAVRLTLALNAALVTHRTVRPQVPEFVRMVAAFTPGGRDSHDDTDTINNLRRQARALTRGMK